MRTSRKRNCHSGFLRGVGVGASAGLLGLVILLGLILVVVPRVAQATTLTILTSSMEPTLPAGTMIVVKPKPPQDFRIGDVMTYQIRSGEPAVVTHRVVGVNSSSDGTFSFVTRGDNNDSIDEAVVTEPQIKGVVWYSVPWVGHISLALNGPYRAWLIPMIAVFLLIYAGFVLASGLLETLGQHSHRARHRATPVDKFGRA